MITHSKVDDHGWKRISYPPSSSLVEKLSYSLGLKWKIDGW